MKTKLSVLCILAAIIALLAGTPLVAFAGESGGSIATGEMPAQWPLLLIPVVTPLIIAGVKWLVPKIPTPWLPVLAPMLGASLDVIAHFAAGTTLTVWLGALLGLCGVGVRELCDQIRKAEAFKAAPALLLFLLPTPMFFCACENLTPTQKESVVSALIEVAKAGLKFGLGAIAKNNPEFAPFVPKLEARFQVTFADAGATSTPEAFAAAIRANVLATVTDPEIQKPILEFLADAVRAEAATPATAAAPAAPQREAQITFAREVAALLNP